MSIKDQVEATLKRRNEKAYQSATIETSARNNQARLNARRKVDTEALTKAVLAKHRPDITLVRYYNAENVTLLLDQAAELGFISLDDGLGARGDENVYTVNEADLLAVMAQLKSCTVKPLDVLPLSHFEQYALAALGVTPFTLLHDVKRVEIRQGDTHVTLYETHPEHVVRLVDGELCLMRQGETYTVPTVDYSSVQDLSVKLQAYKAQHFYGNPDKGNNIRAAENFVDWVRNGSKLTHCKGTTWLDFIFAVRTCDYNTALRRSYGVKDVTLTKLPNTQKLLLP